MQKIAEDMDFIDNTVSDFYTVVVKGNRIPKTC